MVVPLEAHTGQWTRASLPMTYPKPMPQYFRHSAKVGPKTEPDFLAYSAKDQVHVLESKGRAGFGAYGVTEAEINSARNKALRQACRVASVNGVAPVTRTACVFAFDQSGLIGQITDPPALDSSDFVAQLPQLIKHAYATVLDPLFQASARNIGGNYVGIEFAPGWRFGIDRHVYKLVQGAKDQASGEALLDFLNNFQPELGRDDSSRSVGKDGLILIGGPEAKETRWD